MLVCFYYTKSLQIINYHVKTIDTATDKLRRKRILTNRFRLSKLYDDL